MNSSDKLKQIVKDKYSEIAQQDKVTNQSSCCGAGGSAAEVYNIMSDSYAEIEGYNPDADLGLGCGLPTEFALIKPGDTVIDLGSGAGNDCFVARSLARDSGKVIGIDFTPAMIAKARHNAEKLGFNNVEFREGDIEHMPVSDSVADVIVSNCVLNLLPAKKAVVNEIFRVLKPGGHFSISDIVLVGELPEALRQDAEMYAGCVSGAIQKSEYMQHITDSGFEEITIQKEKHIVIPNDILSRYLSDYEITQMHESQFGIFSVTVFARKPGGENHKKPKLKMSELNNSGCTPESGCC